jgi:hypothetical protein
MPPREHEDLTPTETMSREQRQVFGQLPSSSVFWLSATKPDSVQSAHGGSRLPSRGYRSLSPCGGAAQPQNQEPNTPSRARFGRDFGGFCDGLGKFAVFEAARSRSYANSVCVCLVSSFVLFCRAKISAAGRIQQDRFSTFLVATGREPAVEMAKVDESAAGSSGRARPVLGNHCRSASEREPVGQKCPFPEEDREFLGQNRTFLALRNGVWECLDGVSPAVPSPGINTAITLFPWRR